MRRAFGLQSLRRVGLAGLLLVACSMAGEARAAGGLATDALDFPGEPTDRYLTPSEVRTVLHAATEEFYTCFRTKLRGAEAPGEVAVTFVIEREGKPTSIQPELGRAPAELGPCLVKVVEGLVFDDHDGEPMPVSYPLVYQVDTKGARILPYPIVFTKPHAVRLPLLELPEDISPGATRLLELLLTSELEKPGDVSEEEQK